MPDSTVAPDVPTKWFVWVLDANGWRRSGPFPEPFAAFCGRSARFARAYALEAA